MIDAKQVQKQKDGMLMFEAYVLPFLNQFEVLECLPAEKNWSML